MNLLADLLVDGVTLLGVDSVAFLAIDRVTLPLVDDLALCHGVGGALLLGHGLALGLIPGGAGLGSLGGARFLVEGFLDSSGHIDALQFLGVEALFLLDGGTLLAYVIDGGTLVLDLHGTFSSLDLFLDRLLGDLAGSLLGVGTSFTLDISALLPSHGLELGLGHLVADFLGDLATHRLRLRSRSRSLVDAGVELVRHVGQSKEKRHKDEKLHLALPHLGG